MIDLVSVTQALLVAEHLSFSRAAQVLGVRQSAVSRRVRALEDKLGVSLFERDFDRRPAHGGRAPVSGEDAPGSLGDRSRDEGGRQCRTRRRGRDPDRHSGVGLRRVFAQPARQLSRAPPRDRHGDRRRLRERASRPDYRAPSRRRFVTGTPLVSHWDSVVLWEARVFAALPEGHALADGDAIHWESLKDEQFIVSRDAPGPEIHDYIVRRTTTFGRSPSSRAAWCRPRDT